jgi:glycosyltransferase involved in cell wall biosynthesis
MTLWITNTDYEYSPMAPYIVPGPPAVFTVHELGYTSVLNTGFRQRLSRSQFVATLDRLIRSFYLDAIAIPAACPNVVTLAEEDAAALSSMCPDIQVLTSPGGIDVMSGRGAEDDEPSSTGAPVLMFLGNFRHTPNVHAVEYFVQKVMPLVRRIYPSAEFRIYGPHTPGAISALDGREGVRIMGFVDDLSTHFRRATAMVAPIFTGTGQRIKVLEALGAGALLIGTDLSVRSMPLAEGVHYYRANTPDEFAQAIVRAHESPAEARAVARAGQALMAERFSWDAAASIREAIWHSVASQRTDGTVVGAHC